LCVQGEVETWIIILPKLYNKWPYMWLQPIIDVMLVSDVFTMFSANLSCRCDCSGQSHSEKRQPVGDTHRRLLRCQREGNWVPLGLHPGIHSSVVPARWRPWLDGSSEQHTCILVDLRSTVHDSVCSVSVSDAVHGRSCVFVGSVLNLFSLRHPANINTLVF